MYQVQKKMSFTRQRENGFVFRGSYKRGTRANMVREERKNGRCLGRNAEISFKAHFIM